MAKVEMVIVSGPGKWDLLQSIMQVLDPDHTMTRVSFTFEGQDTHPRNAKITGLREAVGQLPGHAGYVEIEGYLTNGASPYKRHGTPFQGTYNPTDRKGWLRVTE